MGIGEGLWITLVGMGLVFASLTVLLVAVTLLDRLFPYRAEPAAQTRADSAASPAPSEPASGAVVAALGGQRYRLEVKDLAAQPMLVAVDGREYRVELRDGGSPQLVVDGQPYQCKVVEAGRDHVTVSVGGESFRVELPVLAAPTQPEPSAASAAPAGPPADGVRIEAPLPGRVLRVLVATGDRVSRGQELCVVEAMKMENSIRAPQDGVVREVRARAGQSVSPGDLLLVI